MMDQEHEEYELFTMSLFQCPTRAQIFTGLTILVLEEAENEHRFCGAFRQIDSNAPKQAARGKQEH